MASEQHAWPHIPWLQWEFIHGWDFSLFWTEFSISNTVFSTWIFMAILFTIVFIFYKSLKKESSVVKGVWLHLIRMVYEMSVKAIWNEKVARKLFFITWWMFAYVLFSNIFWLLVDWVLLVANPDLHLSNYLRPMNADPNTTFALSLSVVLASHIVMVNTRWIFSYIKWYLFNFSGKWFEKFVNVFLGWLHLISEFVKALSLSLRLFWNIFAWIVLISIIAFLWGMIQLFWMWIWEILVLPFWFFELFVAWIQALVFFTLASVYFNQAIEEHH